MSVSTYRAQELARQLIERGIPIDRACRAGAVAFDVSFTLVERFVRFAVLGLDCVRTDQAIDHDFRRVHAVTATQEV